VDWANDYILWQLADSGFPTGAFAHSAGLEAAWRQGGLKSEDIRQFCIDSMHQIGMQTGAFVAAACRDPLRIGELDALYHATCVNHVARRASTLQGRAMLLAAGRAFNLPQVAPLQAANAVGTLHAHFGPIFGGVCGMLNIDPLSAVRLMLFNSARQSLSAAVRLGIIGTLETLPMLHAMGQQISQAALEALQRLPEDAAMPCPLLDLWQSGHDRLYSRLFQS
jgi:urease accessory protein